VHTSARRVERDAHERYALSSRVSSSPVSRTARDGVDASRGSSSENEMRNAFRKWAIDNGDLHVPRMCRALLSLCYYLLHNETTENKNLAKVTKSTSIIEESFRIVSGDTSSARYNRGFNLFEIELSRRFESSILHENSNVSLSNASRANFFHRENP